MIENRIELIQSTIETARNIPSEAKGGLLQQVAGLKSEIKTLSESHPEEASSIAHFAEAAAHEVSRSRRNPQLVETALHGLGVSIQGLEDSHPVLVGMVSRFATTL
jgi:hypothetical protein